MYRCNGGRPYPAADLTEGESHCEQFYGCTKCKAARGTPELATSQLGGRPYPAADVANSMDVQNVRRREAPQICRACNWRRFLALLTGKSSHPFYMVFMSGGEAHPRRMLLTSKSSHPRHILLGGKPSCFFILFVWQLSSPLPDMLMAGESSLGMHTLSTLLLLVFVMIMAGKDPLGS